MSKAFPVSGLKELDAFLAAFPKNLQKGAYRAGLVAAAAPVRDEARRLARKASGKMAKAVKTGSPRQNPDGTFSVTVRLDGEHSFLGFFNEYGVEPHLIASTGSGEGRVAVRKAAEGRGKISQNKAMKIGEDFRSGIIHHPGVTAHPFMRPALDLKADEAVAAFAARIRAYVEGKTGFAMPTEDDG